MNATKVSGFLVLFVGIAILLFSVFTSYSSLIFFQGHTTSRIMVSIIPVVGVGVTLFAMGWVGSNLLRRGIEILKLFEGVSG